ncbi:hypothetical protein CcrKarma_gp026 [Caulobacter virus Karma]|uniref:hypothetical protein n=1 Tax=Caulobacter virus Karma TaxID=1211641 RepID=UPI00028AF062|nr:hypothetical protein CcrKarma_gp026 [Caulobacter virus Karma]AFU87543.1 hypothetical protein CcrKarma_gp026 [Caulobacter virus Karma]
MKSPSTPEEKALEAARKARTDAAVAAFTSIERYDAYVKAQFDKDLKAGLWGGYNYATAEPRKPVSWEQVRAYYVRNFLYHLDHLCLMFGLEPAEIIARLEGA